MFIYQHTRIMAFPKSWIKQKVSFKVEFKIKIQLNSKSMILSQSPPHFCFPLCVQAGISISLMDNFFLGSEIRFGNSTYRVINRIGCWGPDFQYPVYESECFVNNIRVPNRALKTLSRTVAGGQPIWEEEGIWENVNKDITEMLDCFIDPGIDTTLLLFDERFYINSNNVQYICA